MLSAMVRINKNRQVYDPNRNETLKAYRSKFGKVKQDEMHEYVTDESDDEGDDEGDDESVEGDE